MAFSIALFLYNAYLSLFEDGILDCEVLSADMESNIREINKGYPNLQPLLKESEKVARYNG